MFTQQVGRRVGQAAWRTSRRATQRRGYAAESGQSAHPSAFRRVVSTILIGAAFTTVGAVGTWKAMSARGMGFYSDEDSLRKYTPHEADKEAIRVEETINSHPLVAELRRREDLTESRPHMKMPSEYRSRSLTGGALLGAGKVSVPPYAWNDAEGREMVAVLHVGEDLCGHPGIVHGGFLATILDEGLGRCTFKALPHNIAVTANLNINYRKPTPAGTFLVLRAETTKVEGRKAWVKGRLEQLSAPGETPVVFAEAEGLFVSPKYAAVMPRIA
ncbi:Thioesterase superfamily [Geosmithia morbida]|uniref:Thioesterase superfamily n=1 Tax=Geosmithia morbida TaxID=1094350 RepID=A0A9P4YX62_9HYPO|nr:Thioesterase superfamily [Geosmithia morbida]KAF4123313.1 Thioesterase superfamily [Geosmithia morbida]